MAKREPDYTTSFMVTPKPVEMVTPRKIAFLILLQRGWIGRCYHLSPPERFTIYHGALKRANAADGWPSMRSQLYIPSFATIVADWRRAGIIKTCIGIECDLNARLVLMPQGEHLLKNIAPEMMAQTRAVVRATIWKVVLSRRYDERRRLEIDRMQREANRIAKQAKKQGGHKRRQSIGYT